MMFYQYRAFATAQNLMKPSTCYYKLLNVSAKSNLSEIKTQYYQLAKKHHPDVVAAKGTEKEVE